MLQIEDIGDRKQTERELRRLADHDSLTGLLNRRGFMEGLRRELRRMERKDEYGALLLLDLDNFKLVNDTAGHLAGDQVLRTTAEVLRRRLRATDVIGRLGGDEFAALVLNVTPRQASEIAAETTETLRALTVTAGDQTIEVAASIGVVAIDELPRRQRGGAPRGRRPRDVPREEPPARPVVAWCSRPARVLARSECSTSSCGSRPPQRSRRRCTRAASSASAGAAAATTRPPAARCSSPPASPSRCIPLVSPLDEAADRYLLSAHMLEHVLIGDVAPALLVLSLRGPLLAFVVPAALIRLSTRRLRRPLAWLGRPATAAAVWAASMAAWHVPAAYDAALSRPWLHALEHATLPRRGPPRLGRAARPGRSRHRLGRRAGGSRRRRVPARSVPVRRAAREPAALPRLRAAGAPAARPLPASSTSSTRAC